MVDKAVEAVLEAVAVVQLEDDTEAVCALGVGLEHEPGAPARAGAETEAGNLHAEERDADKEAAGGFEGARAAEEAHYPGVVVGQEDGGREGEAGGVQVAARNAEAPLAVEVDVFGSDKVKIHAEVREAGQYTGAAGQAGEVDEQAESVRE